MSDRLYTQWLSEVSCLPTRRQHGETRSIHTEPMFTLRDRLGCMLSRGCCVHYIAQVEVVIVFQLPNIKEDVGTSHWERQMTVLFP